jgi:hypothetical protein
MKRVNFLFAILLFPGMLVRLAGQNRLAVLDNTYANHLHGSAVIEMPNKDILVVGGENNKIIITTLDTNLCIKNATQYILSPGLGAGTYFNAQNTVQTNDGGWVILSRYWLLKISVAGALQWCKQTNEHWTPNRG